MKYKSRMLIFLYLCNPMTYADVILPLPLQGTFTYAVADDMSLAVGMRVLVPLGRNKSYVGLIDRLHEEKPQGYAVKNILQVMDAEPVVTNQQLSLWHWISDYYLSPIGEVYKAALPAGLKAEDGYRPKTETYIRLTASYQNVTALHVALNVLARARKQLEAFTAYLELSGWDQIEEEGHQQIPVTKEELMNVCGCSADTLRLLEQRQMLETYEVEVGRLNHGGDYRPELIQPLSTPQQDAYNELLMSMMKRPVTLLHGVTGSGKTEIYIHLIQRALERHEQVLYLLPEIALTVQMMQRLQRVFGDRLGIYHSRYSDAERVEIWQKQLSKHPYDVILGARSAVFLPFQKLGLVIVDEEHEGSYKQQDPAPRYHARSAAIMLAQQTSQQSAMTPKVILGTATPSLESYHNAKTGKYGLVELKERYQGMELPEIQVVDIADLQRRKMMAGPFSPLLLNKVREALEHGEQAILFQNRRGFAPLIECRQCGWVPTCQHCDVSLTLHRQLNQLTCHYCGFTYKVPTECPCCGSTDLRSRGYGTEKIEEQVREVFPEAHIARMDLDTTRTRNAYERIISDFAAGRTNLLIGTQMISKGLDFDRVSVVGIINADSMLNYPDFRAYEHAFMMMSQVSGRAGRKHKRGLVILQTKQKDIPVIQQVVNHDYQSLYKDLIVERQTFHYPPYYHLVYVFLKHRQDSVVNTAAIEMGSRLRQWFGARVLGPDKPSVAKVKSQNIRKLMLKLELGLDMKKVREYLLLAQSQILADKRYASLQIYYDVDPQ